MDISRRTREGMTLLHLHGPLLAGPDHDGLAPWIARAVRQGAPFVAIDLRDAPAIDAWGVGQLVLAHRELVKAGGELVLIAPAARVLKPLVLARLDGFLRTVGSEPAALERLSARRAERRRQVEPSCRSGQGPGAVLAAPGVW